MKLFNVTVSKGDVTDSMEISAHDADEAKKTALELFYFDGWHATKVEEV